MPPTKRWHAWRTRALLITTTKRCTRSRNSTTNFPTATIIWAVWAIVYQQFENHVIQPQVQKRTVNVHPFITIVSVLLGSALLGILGALLAIPIAASIQILLREYFDPRTLSLREAPPPPDEDTPPPPEPAGDPFPA